jgi:hypothetical protein
MAAGTARTAGAAGATHSRTATSLGTSGDLKSAPGAHSGPPYKFTTQLTGQFAFIPLKNIGMLTQTEHGYRFRTGQQNSHLLVTRTKEGLRFVDTGTRSLKKLSPACRRLKVSVGVAAVCHVPAGISVRHPLLIEVWPRLGSDFTDTSTLPAAFDAAVLADGGNDVARLGAGWDFFNGHSGRDRVWGGAGNDWIRSGLGNDTVEGGPGNDDLIAMEGNDNVRGGPGNDRIGGDDGNDRLSGDAGANFVLCGHGRDNVKADAADRVFHDCEAVKRR